MFILIHIVIKAVLVNNDGSSALVLNELHYFVKTFRIQLVTSTQKLK